MKEAPGITQTLVSDALLMDNSRNILIDPKSKYLKTLTFI